MLRQLKDIAWGSGAILVGGGTIGVMILLSVSAGTSLGIEGFSGLEVIGLAPLTGFISASANTRELRSAHRGPRAGLPGGLPVHRAAGLDEDRTRRSTPSR